VASLVDKCLMRQDEVAGEPRLTMLETIREFGLEQLEASGETSALRRRHAEYFLALAEKADQRVRGPEQTAWLDVLEREHDNLRAALSWSRAGCDNSPDLEPTELGLRLAGALQWFWYIRCHLSEGRNWLEPMLAASHPMPTAVRARGLVTLGRLQQAQGDLTSSATLFDEATALFKQVDDRWWTAFSIGAHGQSCMASGEYERAIALLDEGLALFKAQDDAWGIGWSIGNLGRVAQAQGEQDRALRLFDESLRFKRLAGDPFALALGLHFPGRAAFALGEHARATALFEESLGLFRQVGYPRGVGVALCNLGRLARTAGDLDRAATLYTESLQAQRVEGYRLDIAECFEGLALTWTDRTLMATRLATSRREGLSRAVRLFGAAQNLREAIGTPLSPADRAGHDIAVAATRRELGAEFAAACEAGRIAPLARAIAFALTSTRDIVQSTAAPPVTPPESRRHDVAVAVLTRRERDVVNLIALGDGNVQISTKLVVSRRTVEAHVTSILNKLGLSSRTQIAVWAVEHGLRSPVNV